MDIDKVKLYCQNYTEKTGKELTPSQFVSFVYTAKQLADNPKQRAEFENSSNPEVRQVFVDFTTNFEAIAKWMDMEVPPRQLGWLLPSQVPAEDLQNITPEQSADIINTGGIGSEVFSIAARWHVCSHGCKSVFLICKRFICRIISKKTVPLHKRKSYEQPHSIWLGNETPASPKS